MSDLVRWELRGPVQSLRSQFAQWNPESGDWWPLKNRSVVTFRPDGQVIEIEHHNPDGSVPREARVYDERGRLTEDQCWSNDVQTRRIVHTYDAGGRPVSTSNVDADGTTHECELCRYDDNGRKTKVVFLPRATMYSAEGTDFAYSAPGATTSTTTYDEHERPSEVTFHDANHALVSRVVFSRDQDGRVLSERMAFAGPGGLLGPAIDAEVPADERASLTELFKTVFEDDTFMLATYAYDEKSRRIETIRRMGKLSEERVTVRYDDWDNPVEEVRSDVRREMRIDDGAVQSEERPPQVDHVRFEYQYDAHGNWTERIIWQRSEPNTEEWPSNIERRAIKYYDH